MIRTISMVAIVLAALATPCQAQIAKIGDTLQQCVALYGDPAFHRPDHTTYDYSDLYGFGSAGWVVFVNIYHGKVEGVKYFRTRVNNERLSNQDVEGVFYLVTKRLRNLSDTEVESLLKLNGGSKQWSQPSRTPGEDWDRKWWTKDGTLRAYYEGVTHDGFLAIQTRATLDREKLKSQH